MLRVALRQRPTHAVCRTNLIVALIELGLEAERVVAVGLGEDFPIASNDDEDGRSRNRRVDVILLDEQ